MIRSSMLQDSNRWADFGGPLDGRNVLSVTGSGVDLCLRQQAPAGGTTFAQIDPDVVRR